ncbi:hypothetical protein V5279_24415 [Bradyrhizobium sp. 26S5]|uniref:hypothetical protein n=1 Tax=Bradyrhizobium sp. 26S5 TaxID=3139729 RepID=UPI0030D4F31F
MLHAETMLITASLRGRAALPIFLSVLFHQPIIDLAIFAGHLPQDSLNPAGVSDDLPFAIDAVAVITLHYHIPIGEMILCMRCDRPEQ